MNINLRLDAKGWGMLLLLSVFWGSSFLFVKIALEELSPLMIVVTRVTLAAIVSLSLMKLLSLSLPKGWSIWRSFLVMGMLNNIVPFLLIVWGQQYILAGVAAILNAATPAFTVIVAQLFTEDEKATAAKAIGISVAISGVAIVIGFNALTSFSITNLGQLAILFAGLSYAFASVFGRKFGRAGVAPLVVTTGQLVISSLLLLPAAFFVQPDALHLDISLKVLMALTGLAVISTAFAYLLYFKLIATAGATNATLVTVLVPVSAAFLTWLVLGEKLPDNAYSGMSVIVIGLLILDGRLIRWLKKNIFNTRRE